MQAQNVTHCDRYSQLYKRHVTATVWLQHSRIRYRPNDWSFANTILPEPDIGYTGKKILREAMRSCSGRRQLI